MELNKFKSLLNKIQDNSDIICQLYKLNIDIINFIEKYDSIIWLLMKEIFTENQIDMIEWWLFDGVDKFIYDSETKEVIYDLTEIDNLYEYINKNK